MADHATACGRRKRLQVFFLVIAQVEHATTC
jgi:hypothetical protein